MDNDLNTPEALAVLDRLASYGYESWQELELAQGTDEPALRSARGKVVRIADTFHQLRDLLGLAWRPLRDLTEEEKTLWILYETTRKNAKESKDFTRSDALRKQLQEKGMLVQDTPIGSILIPKE